MEKELSFLPSFLFPTIYERQINTDTGANASSIHEYIQRIESMSKKIKLVVLQQFHHYAKEESE